MDGVHALISLGLTSLLLWSSPVNSDNPTINLCHDAKITTNHVELNMDTSVIAGTTVFCQCMVVFIMDASFNMTFHNITSPQCDTEILLSDGSFQPTCQGDTIQVMAYAKQFKTGEEFTIRVKANGNSRGSMSGTIQMRTSDDTNFTLECFKTEVRRTAMTSTVTTTTLTTSMLPSSKSISTLTTAAVSVMVSTESTTYGVTMITTHLNAIVTKKEFPEAAIVGGIVGAVAVVFIIVIVGVICHRRYRSVCDPKESAPFPESRDHPTYNDLTNRENTEYDYICCSTETATVPNCSVHPTYSDLTNRENTEYEQAGHNTDRVYQNGSDQIPESRDHPTYSDLTKREHTEYEHIDHNNGPGRVYQNVAIE